MKNILFIVILVVITANIFICNETYILPANLNTIKFALNKAYAGEGVANAPCINIGYYYPEKYYDYSGSYCTDSEGLYCGNSQFCRYNNNATNDCQSWTCVQEYN